MDITLACPHCKRLAVVPYSKIDKPPLYHGELMSNNKTIPSKCPAEWVQYLQSTSSIVNGCGKPFMVMRKSSVSFEAVPFNTKPVNKQRRNTIIPSIRIPQKYIQ